MTASETDLSIRTEPGAGGTGGGQPAGVGGEGVGVEGHRSGRYATWRSREDWLG